MVEALLWKESLDGMGECREWERSHGEQSMKQCIACSHRRG